MIFLPDHLSLNLIDSTLDGFGIARAAEKVYWRDSGAYIYSSASGTLDFVATTLNFTGTMNFGPIDVDAGTQTTSNPLFDGTATWNAAGVTFDAIFVNITNTASAAASRLLELQVGGSEMFGVTKAGALNMAGKIKTYGGAAPTDGQIPIGHTANGALELAVPTGTANRVTVTMGAGSMALTTPQDTHTGAVPTFAGIALTKGAITDPAAVLSGTVTWNDVADTFTGISLNVTDTASAAASMLLDLQVGSATKFNVLKSGNVNCGTIGVTGGTVTTDDPCIEMDQTWNAGGVTFTGIDLDVTDTASTAASLLMALKVGAAPKFSVRKDGGLTTAGKIIGYGGAALTDGQVLIGATATGDLTAGAISGTANQITVTLGGGTIALSAPQDIHTSATPQFSKVGLGAAAGAAYVITSALADLTPLLSVTQGAGESSNLNLIDVACTWNNAANTPTLIKFNTTDTASNAASLFLDLQKSNISQFSVGKSGTVTAAGTGTFNSVAMLDGKVLSFGTGVDVTETYDGTDNVLDEEYAGTAGHVVVLSATSTATCTEGRVIAVDDVTVADAVVNDATVAGICRVGGVGAAQTVKIAVSGVCSGVADAAIDPNSALKSCTGGRLGQMVTSVNTGDSIATGAGGNFGNQPANDSVTLVSDNAGDTQNATVYGTTNGTNTVVTEVIALTGVGPVVTVKNDWGEILGVELASNAIGTITFKETSGGLTISTIAAGQSQAGVVVVPGGSNRAFNVAPTIVANGATTKKVGIVGTTAAYAALTNDCNALNGTTAVTLPTACNTVTKVLVGDVEGARNVTVAVGAEDDSEFCIAFADMAGAAAKDDPVRVRIVKGI